MMCNDQTNNRTEFTKNVLTAITHLSDGEHINAYDCNCKKYSSNLTEMMAKVREYQPALASMLDKYVLSDGDSFWHNYNGKWEETTCGQVLTEKDVYLFLHEDKLKLCADASIVAMVANSITQHDHCAWCSTKIECMSEGCVDDSSLSLEACWVRFK